MKKLILFAVIVLTACRAELPVEEKLSRANAYLSEHGGEPAYRAMAYDLYKAVLDESSVKQQRIQAHFGVGIIGVFDLLQGAPTLLADSGEGDDEGDAPDLPPADALAETIDTLVHQALDRNIARHLALVAAEDDFEFHFENLSFPSTDPTEAPLDLSGEWDTTEVRMVYGLMEIVIALEEIVYSYDGVLETILKAAFSGAELPELPTTPAEFPNWLADAAEAAGLSPLPWVDPSFGVVGANDRLAQAAERIQVGLGSMVDGMAYLKAESDDQDNEVFPNDGYITSILELVLPDLDPLIKGAIGSVIDEDVVEDIMARLHASSVDETLPFLLPDDIWGLLDIVLGGYDGPQNPVELRVPAISIASLLNDPIQDLKDPEAGLFPFFDANGRFIVHSEQEPRTDGELAGEPASGDYEDTGVDGFVDENDDGKPDDTSKRPGEGNGKFDDVFALRADTTTTLKPLKHKAPNGRIDAANGIVDPVYLFFGDASFHGFFVPMTTGTGDADYAADLSKDYKNEDLMRLVSSLVWLLSESSF